MKELLQQYSVAIGTLTILVVVARATYLRCVIDRLKRKLKRYEKVPQ